MYILTYFPAKRKIFIQIRKTEESIMNDKEYKEKIVQMMIKIDNIEYIKTIYGLVKGFYETEKTKEC